MTSLILSSASSTRPTHYLNDMENEEDQLNRINLQALQNRDPYITTILDQAQRVCVYKFLADKREWERKDLEGSLFVYERSCEPEHGFVILSTVSRETFVQIIKPSMEFKHSPNYEAFLQYKVDVGDIYGIWFISKNDCPRVTECLKSLTSKAKDLEHSKQTPFNTNLINSPFVALHTQDSADIYSLLVNAQEKFQESKRKDESNSTDLFPSMPAALARLFSAKETQSNLSQPTHDEREEELKKTLGILRKPALSVTELEKQLLHANSRSELVNDLSIYSSFGLSHSVPVDKLVKPVPISSKNPISSIDMNNSTNTWRRLNPPPPPSNASGRLMMDNGRLMTPAEFQNFHGAQSPVLIAPHSTESTTASRISCNPSSNQFSKDNLRQLLVDMLQNDEEFLIGLHNAYIENQHRLA